LVKTNGIGAARLGKAARPSQSGEAARLGKDAVFTRKQLLFTMQDLTPIFYTFVRLRAAKVWNALALIGYNILRLSTKLQLTRK